ncbi:hypothetical protein ACQJBY_022990 [Aegilops geniculata]
MVNADAPSMASLTHMLFSPPARRPQARSPRAQDRHAQLPSASRQLPAKKERKEETGPYKTIYVAVAHAYICAPHARSARARAATTPTRNASRRPRLGSSSTDRHAAPPSDGPPRARRAAGRGRRAVVPCLGLGGGRRRRAWPGEAARVRGVDGRREEGHPRAARAGVRGARDEQAGEEGAGRHGRAVRAPGRRHRRRGGRWHRAPALRRAARRHGRAPAAGGSGVGAPEQGGREDARLRPRRAHGDAAGRRQDPPRAPQRPAGDGDPSFPAGRGGGHRGQEDGGGWRREQRRGHLRVPRHRDPPHRRGWVEGRPAASRLRLLRSGDHREGRPRRHPPEQRGPRRGRLQRRPRPPEPRLPGGRPPGLPGRDGDEVPGRRRVQRDPGLRHDRRHFPVLLQRRVHAAEAADRGGDRGAVGGAPVRGGGGLPRRRAAPAGPDHQQPRAARALRGRRHGYARRRRRPGRHGAVHGERGLRRLLRGGTGLPLLLRRDTERGGRVGARRALAALPRGRRRAPVRRGDARQPRHDVPAAPERARGLARRAVAARCCCWMQHETSCDPGWARARRLEEPSYCGDYHRRVLSSGFYWDAEKHVLVAVLSG